MPPKRHLENPVVPHRWTQQDLQGLSEKIRSKFQWEHVPHTFQLKAIESQLLQKDVLIHAGTGSGKTVVAAGPHAHEKCKGKVTIMVSPLIALQEEQVSTSETKKCFTTHINDSGRNISKGVWAVCYGRKQCTWWLHS